MVAGKPAEVLAPFCWPPPHPQALLLVAQRPEVYPWLRSGGTGPGPDSHALPDTCPGSSGPAAPLSRHPTAPQPRSAPPLPCAALPCWAARAWTSRTSRQSPGTRPEPMAWSSARRGRGGVAAPGRARGGGGGDWRVPRGGSGLGVGSAPWGARAGAGRRPEGRPRLSHPTPSFARGEL